MKLSKEKMSRWKRSQNIRAINLEILQYGDRLNMIVTRHYCPCCEAELQLEMMESESGEIQFRLFHYTPEISYAEIQAKGFEFGSIEGGEIINGENANISVQQNN